ncbi:KAT8 regulatory NSL complex subunit 1-like protein [Engraulis encrasicolus]|uniref:KAT8 regulatory NSL complex subunit 1-like protein n=1 Tax=Engraulis encrasicolus TaxID=184585 RepID=UPI002FD77A56
MAPALTRTDKNGIHLSSSLLTDGMDSDNPVLGIDLEPQMKLLEDTFSPTMWLNLSSLPFLDPCGSKNPLKYPDALLQPLLQSSGYYKTVMLSSPRDLVGQLSLNKAKKSLLTKSDLLSPFPKLSSLQDVPDICLLQLSNSIPVSPDVANCPSLTRHSPGKHLIQHSAVPLDRIGAGDGIGIGGRRGQHWSSVKQAVKGQTLRHLSEQRNLVGRVDRLQRRLQTLLGEHVSRHCTQQLDGLKAKYLQKDIAPKSPTQSMTSPCASWSPALSTDPKLSDAHQAEAEADLLAVAALDDLPACAPTRTDPAASTDRATDLHNFARCASAALHGLHSALDSDATDSSSDEEWEPVGTTSRTRPQAVRGSAEWRWQAERAEMASRWTWLQLRVAELELHIQQVGDLRKRLLQDKGGVVLADCQPKTDTQIQQTLLTEMAGLSCFTTSHGTTLEMNSGPDLETEPCSPTRLLRNIERQSAQLSQIVNSLMPPHSLSPSSSPVPKHSLANGWAGAGQHKRPFDSGGVVFHSGPQGGAEGVQKKRRVCRRRQPLVPATCVSARTRPLHTYHKPRLFHSSMPCSNAQQEEEDRLSSAACPSCRSCDPVSMCVDPCCPGNPGLAAQRFHAVLSLRSDAPLSSHLLKGLHREDWTLRPLQITTLPHSPIRYLSCGRKQPRHTSAFNFGHTPVLPHRRRPKSRGEASEVRWESGVRGPPRRTHRRRPRKRLYHDSSLEEAELLSSLVVPPSPEESAEETLTPLPHHTRHRATGYVRRRNGESTKYNIDNIVIPMSLAAPIKVEKLQYKDIVTPSWKVVEAGPLEKEEENKKEEQEEEEEEEQRRDKEDGDQEVECLSDELFALRHQSYESREKLRWSAWEKSRRRRRGSRSALYGPGSATRHHPQPHADWGSWSPRGADSDGELQEDNLPRVPWEKRAFPLSIEEEEALKFVEEEEDKKAPPPFVCWSGEECSGDSSDEDGGGARGGGGGDYSGSERGDPTPPPSGRRRRRTWAKAPRLHS